MNRPKQVAHNEWVNRNAARLRRLLDDPTVRAEITELLSGRGQQAERHEARREFERDPAGEEDPQRAGSTAPGGRLD